MDAVAQLDDGFVADKIALLYSGGIAAFDYGMSPVEDEGICWSIARVGDVMVLVFRGSRTPQDWFRDFLAVPTLSLAHPRTGIVPAGFAVGMETAYRDILPLLQFPFIVAGHSLGAARAAWFMARYGGAATLLRGVLCGCPSPGDLIFRSALDHVQIASYRNLADPVCEVPWFPFFPLRPFIRLQQKPAHGILSIEDHHIALYQAGIHQLDPMGMAA